MTMFRLINHTSKHYSVAKPNTLTPAPPGTSHRSDPESPHNKTVFDSHSVLRHPYPEQVTDTQLFTHLGGNEC